MEVKVLFEDESLVVVDKPTGVVVNSLPGGSQSLADWFKQEGKLDLDSGDGEFDERGGVVHRLDKETSGLLVMAKTPEAFLSLKNQFKERRVKKEYLALVWGKVRPTEGEIKAPIGRSKYNHTQFVVDPFGREAQTTYHVEKVFLSPQGECSLLRVFPMTGRTHQIRVHLKYVGHPIVSDPDYGGKRGKGEDLEICPRLFLHAAKLTFFHPKGGEEMVFESKLPEDLEATVRRLVD